jgi:hypothetical protein
MSADVPCVIFFLCSNCVIFRAFRTTLDVVVVQPFWFEQGMFAVLKLCLFRTECILTIIMGRTWFVDVPTILYKIRNYLDHPHVSRFLTIVSLRGRVRPPGSSFAKFIKSYGSRFFFLVKSGVTIH